ncbi:MAG: hypothetical protein ACOYJV_06035 [Aminivibrio sp.]|jgi:DNA polymerase-3 subunit delta'
MSDLPAAIAESEAWKRVEYFVDRDAFPHCAILSVSERFQRAVAAKLARLLLCPHRSPGDGCTACRAWSGGHHPDLISGGEPGKAPLISECREIIRSMSLKPVVSDRRCALIFSSDLMLQPAANSLLKLAEEPPDHGIIIFLAEDENRLLPTLRSRAWNLSLKKKEKDVKEIPPPSSPGDWQIWAEKNSAIEIEEFVEQFDPWISWLTRTGDSSAAWRVDRVKNILSTGRLSRTMAMDFTLLALKEGIDFEHLFGYFW